MSKSPFHRRGADCQSGCEKSRILLSGGVSQQCRKWRVFSSLAANAMVRGVALGLHYWRFESGMCRQRSRMNGITSNMTPAFTAPSAKARQTFKLRSIALPNEHGSWGILFEPLVLGIAVAPSSASVFIAMLYI